MVSIPDFPLLIYKFDSGLLFMYREWSLPTMLIDTHAHIYLDIFQDDVETVLARSREAGISVIIMPAIDIPSIDAALSLCNQFSGLYAMTALHPTETGNATDADMETVRAYCGNPWVVAVGESGLDYYHDRSYLEIQHRFLRLHAQLAMDSNLPLVLHNRDASEDLVRILREERDRSSTPERLRGVFHCFGGPRSLAADVMDLGFHIGLGGTLTFKNGGVPDTIVDVPLDRIVLETDAPFLAPVPYRGTRNEPSYVRIVAEKLAELRCVDVAEIERRTTENAIRLFGLEI